VRIDLTDHQSFVCKTSHVLVNEKVFSDQTVACIQASVGRRVNAGGVVGRDKAVAYVELCSNNQLIFWRPFYVQEKDVPDLESLPVLSLFPPKPHFIYASRRVQCVNRRSLSKGVAGVRKIGCASVASVSSGTLLYSVPCLGRPCRIDHLSDGGICRPNA